MSAARDEVLAIEAQTRAIRELRESLCGEAYWQEEVRMARQAMLELESEFDALMVRRAEIEARLKAAERRLGRRAGDGR